MADYELPAYDDIVEDDPDDEPVMDENERIARQEEEDARIAKELFEKEQKASQAEVRGGSISQLLWPSLVMDGLMYIAWCMYSVCAIFCSLTYHGNYKQLCSLALVINWKRLESYL